MALALDSVGRLLCINCGCQMRLTVITLEEKRFGGKMAEFRCSHCGDGMTIPLNGSFGSSRESPPDCAAA